MLAPYPGATSSTLTRRFASASPSRERRRAQRAGRLRTPQNLVGSILESNPPQHTFGESNTRRVRAKSVLWCDDQCRIVADMALSAFLALTLMLARLVESLFACFRHASGRRPIDSLHHTARSR